MKYSKLYNFKEMNSYQFIAVTGLVMTLAAHIILLIRAKEMSNFWALYLCWLVVFILGSIANFRSKSDGSQHHHHHH